MNQSNVRVGCLSLVIIIAMVCITMIVLGKHPMEIKITMTTDDSLLKTINMTKDIYQLKCNNSTWNFNFTNKYNDSFYPKCCYPNQANCSYNCQYPIGVWTEW